MDIKNGFDIVYNPRIANILGFGSSLVPTLWEELDQALTRAFDGSPGMSGDRG